MARKRRRTQRLPREQFPAPRPKFVTPRIGRVPGYQRLSPTELEQMGMSRKAERYLGPNGEVISKRQYLRLQRSHFGVTVGTVSLERYREMQAAEGAPSRRSVYQRAIQSYNRRYYKGKATPGEVIRNERFQLLWSRFQKNRHVKGKRAFRAGAQRAGALRAIGMLRIDPATGKWTSDPSAQT